MEEEEEEDPVPEITKDHFEEAMKYARWSVSDPDIRRYEMIFQVCVLTFLLRCRVDSCRVQQSRGFGNNFRFPEGSDPSGSTTAPAGNAGFQDDTQEDNLYA